MPSMMPAFNVCLIVAFSLILYSTPVAAFGAGNIGESKPRRLAFLENQTPKDT